MTLKELLEEHDFESYRFSEFPITQESLKPYDILVFACPDFAKIALSEIDEIENWVRQDGGGLLLLSHAGGDKGRGSNLSELAERFGIAFENDQVLSPHNYGMENLPRVSIFSPPHPITEGLTEICFRAGCSLTSIGGAVPIALSDDNADPFSVPLIIAGEADYGFVAAMGSYEVFRDEIGCGIENEQHKILALSIFTFLMSEYRKNLKEKGQTITITSGAPAQVGQPIRGTSFGGLENLGSQTYSPITIQSEIKISSKSDLIQTMYSILNEINSLKSLVENLIQSVVASEDQIIELKTYQELQKKVQKPPEIPTDANRGPLSDEDFKNLYQLKEPPLKPLPPRPKGMSSKEKEDEEVAIEPIPQKVKKKKPDKEEEEPQAEEPVVEEPVEEISVEELKAELDGLDSKQNSVKNLIIFIKKKKKDGKIKQKDYDKQMKKLEYDLDNTNKRIEEIKNLLKK